AKHLRFFASLRMTSFLRRMTRYNSESPRHVEQSETSKILRFAQNDELFAQNDEVQFRKSPSC
ncbi:MAG: hypothetical protein NT027_04625, partial [Proteobacteria bacterium]|nr:hypothetical protein [Pseudomonadota bacterium]